MKDIVIKTGNNRILYYYSKDGICVRNLKSSYDGPKLIYAEGVSDFDVIERENGDISVICQDSDGGIVYLSENEKSYLKSTLLKSKKQIPYDKYFRLIKLKGEICAFYIIEHGDKKILSFQQVEKDNSLPYAVDEISGSYYYAFVDESGVLYVFYEKENRCGYKYCIEGQWSSFDVISQGVLVAAVVYDENIYLAVSDDAESSLIRLGSVSKECKILKTNFFDKASDISLICENDCIWVVRVYNGNVSAIRTDADFGGWGRSIVLGAEAGLKKIRVKSELENGCPDECFAALKGGILKPVVYKKLLESEKNSLLSRHRQNETVNHQKEETEKIYIELNKLKIEISEIKKQIFSLLKQNGEKKQQ